MIILRMCTFDTLYASNTVNCTDTTRADKICQLNKFEWVPSPKISHCLPVAVQQNKAGDREKAGRYTIFSGLTNLY